MVNILVEFNIYKLGFLDLFALIYVIFGIKALQKTLMKFLIVLIDGKEILIFFILFMMAAAMIARLLFFRIANYYDAEGTTFGFNFLTFSNSLYSLTIANFLADNFFDVVGNLMTDHKILISYWLIILFLNKFMLSNFLCGILYNCYNGLFGKDISYMNKSQFKQIRWSLKREINAENLKGSVFKKIMTNYTKTGDFSKGIEEIENFYSLAMTNKHKMVFDKENPDSIGGWYNELRTTLPYIVTLGSLEGVMYFLIIIAFEIDEGNTYWFVTFILVINFILMIDRFLYLLNNYYGEEEKWLVVDIILTMIIFGLGMQCLMISEADYYREIMVNNRYMFKWLASLTVCKCIRFLKLFAYNQQIAIVTKVIFDSFAFLKDIIGIIMIFFFLFGSVGMAMFGGNVNSSTPGAFEEVYGDEPDDGLLDLNFNDYYFSICTLYTVMLGGWTDIIKVNTVGFGNENSMIYNIYFIFYFFFVSLCFLNTLFGFLVDNVSANLERTLEDEEEEEEGEKGGKGAGGSSYAGSEMDGDNSKLGDLRDDMDSFIGMDKEGGDGQDGPQFGEQSDKSFKMNKDYDPVEKVIEKIDA